MPNHNSPEDRTPLERELLAECERLRARISVLESYLTQKDAIIREVLIDVNEALATLDAHLRGSA